MSQNGCSLCNKVHSLTTYGDNSFTFSDTGDSCIKAYNPTVKQCSVIVGNGKGTRDKSKAQFSQPTSWKYKHEFAQLIRQQLGLERTSLVRVIIKLLF